MPFFAFTSVKAFFIGGFVFTLVLGGAGSGKSKFSEDLMLNFSGTSAYIATMESFGKEAED